MPSDEKYIVFKRDADQSDPGNYHISNAIDDAVVIRKQDVFSAPALYVYAHTIALSAGLLRTGGALPQAEQLQKIADYFAECAEEASELGKKMPD